MIAIIDYGAGNLRSVANTLDEIGAEYRIFATPPVLDRRRKSFCRAWGISVR